MQALYQLSYDPNEAEKLIHALVPNKGFPCESSGFFFCDTPEENSENSRECWALWAGEPLRLER
jgi:hypothetical protein